MTENERAIELMKEWCVQKCTVECGQTIGSKACQECSVLGVGKVLNEVDHQRAEIERLQKEGREAVDCFNRMETFYKIKCKELEVAKPTAIEEFWTKVRSYAVVMGCYHIVEYGDSIVKEMVGK